MEERFMLGLYEIIEKGISTEQKIKEIKDYFSDQILTSTEATEYLGISKTTLSKYIDQEIIKPFKAKDKKGYLFLKDELAAYNNSKGVHRQRKRKNSSSKDLNVLFSPQGFISIQKHNGVQYVYLRKNLDKGASSKHIYAFGRMPDALNKMKSYLEAPEAFPKELKELGFTTDHLVEWIEQVEDRTKTL
ncbi:helix-turn-helix domain-containing protein [Bacillus sp. S2(2019)]|nr:helix-turn-helix domain-containing protein [Bacillus sp. S2(2019)]